MGKSGDSDLGRNAQRQGGERECSGDLKGSRSTTTNPFSITKKKWCKRNDCPMKARRDSEEGGATSGKRKGDNPYNLRTRLC